MRYRATPSADREGGDRLNGREAPDTARIRTITNLTCIERAPALPSDAPRKLQLLVRGKAVFGSYAKVLDRGFIMRDEAGHAFRVWAACST